MKVEVRFSIFLQGEKKRPRRRSKTLRIDKQIVNLNFLSISSPIFVDLKKKENPLLYKVSWNRTLHRYPRYIYPSAILLVLILLYLIPQSLILHNSNLLTEIQLIVASKIHFFGEEGFDVGVEGLPVGVFEVISVNWGD